MASSTCSSISAPVEALGPHQPTSFCFPKCKFGKKAETFHSFQPSWFCSWSWLHYNEATDSVVCFLCAKAVREQKMNPKVADVAFVSDDYLAKYYEFILAICSYNILHINIMYVP